MPTLEDIADGIVRREGGFVNDPDDPGGPTNFGVTLDTLRRFGRDMTGDGVIDVADLRRLTKAQARQFFLNEYFHAPGLGNLPSPLHATVFDMQVNAGRRAIKLLQQLVSKMGFPASDDGIIGPRTQAAVFAAHEAAPDHIVDAYGIERRNFYYRLADGRAQSRKYARRRDGGKGGWIVRAEEFISPKYHLSDAEHRARTASWA